MCDHLIVYWCSITNIVDRTDRSCAVARNAGVVLLSNHGKKLHLHSKKHVH